MCHLFIFPQFGITRNKCKSLFFLACAVMVFLFVVTTDNFASRAVNTPILEENEMFHQPSTTAESQRTQICPEKKTSIYYVKIHKTGSSTFQNILYRLGMNQNLTFALIGCAYGMSYPHPAKQEYLFAKPTFDGFHNYDLLTDHSMFDSEYYKAYMPHDTKVVTLLRHPLNQLKSTFGFWNLPMKFEIPSRNKDPITTYLENPSKYEQTRNSFGCPPTIQMSQTQNPQSHHLGLRNQGEGRDDIIETFVQDLDDKMYLVMILERFEESLILFKRSFCLSTKDILHLNLFSTSFFNRKTYDVDNNSRDNLIQKHRQWSKADYQIYDHFAEKLDRKITESGQDFQDELNSFRATKEKVRKFCSENCYLFESLARKASVHDVRETLRLKTLKIDASRWSEEFSINSGDCLLMMFETLMYDEAIKAKQWPSRCPNYSGPVNTHTGPNKVPIVNPKYCNKQDHFVPYFSWEAVKNTAYFRKQSCLKNF